ncbi:hypothetical protein IB276_10840 [Ensifer sp. ENS04]|uniref:hypothetical protein n=1 Tax=Ensifer sp. ENS04 TaxID=2769281 RepID=UPI00177A8876|nr:hypothetical protein [Ensifer sp. ENS04]MBD9539947.1 hypothetical protein [Ensifer sp. ENS04]
MSQPAPQPLNSTRVSYHAVTRYVQRVLGVIVDGAWETEKERAQAHADEVCSTIESIRELIWSPAVAWAVGQGFPNIGNGQFHAAVSQPAGVITTICEPYRRETHRLRVLSDREMRVKRMQIKRRFQRRTDTETSVLAAGTAED